MKIKFSLVDDDGKTYEGEVDLKKQRTKPQKPDSKGAKNWYRSGSTIEKIITLIEEEFFNQNRTVGDIIKKLKSKDYHFKSPELTLPLRNIVRRGLLEKTKDLPDGTKSKNWTYIASG
ncbi:MAG: hypothetical protein QXE82_05195 [Candidatus Nitrosotenuis sp.]